ncbi:hypothetical protein ACFYPH_06420 [Micromonospora sp. NPDC005252]|uniref:hypothetical protein n=1 Tax=Micromonospora sp. NPDC005252 TaxID=3364228 RepID=UPI00369F3CC7
MNSRSSGAGLGEDMLHTVPIHVTHRTRAPDAAPALRRGCQNLVVIESQRAFVGPFIHADVASAFRSCGMRLFRTKSHLDREECRATIAAVSAFSSMSHIAWEVNDCAAGQPLPTLAESLIQARHDGRALHLPKDSRHWLDLRYQYPDTGYSLALVLVWSFAVTRLPDDGPGSGDYVRIATWHLRQFLPHSALSALPAIEGAFDRHRQSMKALAG